MCKIRRSIEYFVGNGGRAEGKMSTIPSVSSVYYFNKFNFVQLQVYLSL